MKLYTILSPEEIALAELHGRKQHSKPYYKDNDVMNHIIGKMAEYAKAKVTGQTVNNEFFTNKGDGGIDFPDGTQVKCRDWPYNNVEMFIDNTSFNNDKVINYELYYISKKDYKKGEVYFRGSISKKNVIKHIKFSEKFKSRVVYLKDFDIKN
jgi:hypothetical protein